MHRPDYDERNLRLERATVGSSIHRLPVSCLLGHPVGMKELAGAQGLVLSELRLKLPAVDQPPVFGDLTICEAGEDHRRPFSTLAGG